MYKFLTMIFLVLAISANTYAQSEPQNKPGELKPITSKKGELFFEENFDEISQTGKKWIIRQNTRWTVENGILKGLPSTKEYQKKLIESGKNNHLGLKPKIVLANKIKKYIISFKFMFDDTPEEKSFTFGHHISKIIFDKNIALIVARFASEDPRGKTNDLIIEPFKWYKLLAEVSDEHLTIQVRKPDGQVVSVKGHFPEYKKKSKRDPEFTGSTGGQLSLDDIKVWTVE